MSHGARWLIVACALAGLSARADAEVFKVFGEVHGGGVAGRGLNGDPVDAAGDESFFANVPHLAYGARVGARLLILEGTIQHHQFTDGSDLSTWTQFSAGIGIQPELGDEKARKARRNGYAEVGVHLGFGLGTGQQVTPPLSADELSDRAFLVEGRLGFGKHLGKVFDIGVVVPVSWGYFLKSGVANDLQNHYQSLQAAGLLYLRMNIKLL